MLTSDSPCDNVLLEHRLALELRERGLIERIFPIMIGDFSSINQTYSNYFASGCHPTFPKVASIIVASVEAELCENLGQLCLGSPLLNQMSITIITSKIVENQGSFIEGDNNPFVFDPASLTIESMVEGLDNKYSDWKKKQPFVQNIHFLTNKERTNKLSSMKQSKKKSSFATRRNSRLQHSLNILSAQSINVNRVTNREVSISNSHLDDSMIECVVSNSHLDDSMIECVVP